MNTSPKKRWDSRDCCNHFFGWSARELTIALDAQDEKIQRWQHDLDAVAAKGARAMGWSDLMFEQQIATRRDFIDACQRERAHILEHLTHRIEDQYQRDEQYLHAQ